MRIKMKMKNRMRVGMKYKGIFGFVLKYNSICGLGGCLFFVRGKIAYLYC